MAGWGQPCIPPVSDMNPRGLGSAERRFILIRSARFISRPVLVPTWNGDLDLYVYLDGRKAPLKGL
jgi:hypothetical protein